MIFLFIRPTYKSIELKKGLEINTGEVDAGPNDVKGLAHRLRCLGVYWQANLHFAPAGIRKSIFRAFMLTLRWLQRSVLCQLQSSVFWVLYQRRRLRQLQRWVLCQLQRSILIVGLLVHHQAFLFTSDHPTGSIGDPEGSLAQLVGPEPSRSSSLHGASWALHYTMRACLGAMRLRGRNQVVSSAATTINVAMEG